jgi:hypothetical protein
VADKLTETIRMRFDNRPIRYIINTSVSDTRRRETVVKYRTAMPSGRRA